jgi:ketosteroid isomerase-like protein
MKIRAAWIIGLIAFAWTVALQPGALYAETADEAAVAAAVEQLRQAMLSADESKLAALTAEQLSYGHSSGKIETKPEFIAPIAGKKTVYKTLTQSDQKITLAGSDAIVRHLFTSDVEVDGKVNAVKLNVLQVWQKDGGGQWKLLARQAVGIK